MAGSAGAAGSIARGFGDEPAPGSLLADTRARRDAADKRRQAAQEARGARKADRGRQDRHQQAYEAGQATARGDVGAVERGFYDGDADAQAAWDQGHADHRAAAKPAASPRVASRVAGDGAGLLLAALVYPLGLALLRGGPDRARGWLAAKFLNKPMGAGSLGVSPASPSSPPTPSMASRLRPVSLPSPSSRAGLS